MPAPRPGLQRPAARPCSTTTSTRPAGSPRTSPPAGRPRPDLVLWPENASDIDPSATRTPRALIDRRRPGDRRADPGRHRRRRADPGHRPQRRHRLGPRHRPGGALRQAAPGAVRRVHPAPRRSPGWSAGEVDRVGRDFVGGDRPGRADGRPGHRRRRDLLRGRVRRAGPRRARRRRPARRADQQRHLRPQRRDLAAAGHEPAAGRRARPAGAGRGHQRGQRGDRARTGTSRPARTSSQRTCSSGRSRCARGLPSPRASAPGRSGLAAAAALGALVAAAVVTRRRRTDSREEESA